jgi:hypothetical protein
LENIFYIKITVFSREKGRPPTKEAFLGLLLIPDPAIATFRD